MAAVGMVGFAAVSILVLAPMDETVTEGSRWGLTIGDSRAASLSKLRSELREKDAWVSTSSGDDEKRLSAGDDLSALSSPHHLQLLPGDQWHVQWHDAWVNYMTLKFSGDVLVSVRKRRLLAEPL
jgi:hypothetical protein